VLTGCVCPRAEGPRGGVGPFVGVDAHVCEVAAEGALQLPSRRRLEWCAAVTDHRLRGGPAWR
jgi:hypothetical protein